MVKGMQYARKIAATAPYKAGIVREVDPGPEYTTDEQLKGAHTPGFLCGCTTTLTFFVRARRRVHQEDHRHRASSDRDPQYGTAREKRLCRHGASGERHMLF